MGSTDCGTSALSALTDPLLLVWKRLLLGFYLGLLRFSPGPCEPGVSNRCLYGAPADGRALEK